MFDLVFSGIGALNQVGAFIAGSLCAGIGGLLVGNSVYWRLRAIRVDGQVMGVRQGTKTVNAVYRYTLPSGQSHEATSTEGSSSVRGKETGTVVPLLVMAQQPDKVVEARSHIVDVVGVVLLAAGAWIHYIAVTSWPFGPMTWIVAAVLVGRFAIAIYRSILPREKRLRPASWLERRKAAGNINVPVQRIEDIVSLPENRAREAEQRASNHRYAPIFLVVGLALLALSVYLGRTLARLESSGLRAPGVVLSLEESHSSDGSTFYPVVNFSTTDGGTIRFRDSTGTNPPSHRVGDVVTVLYLPGAPQHAVIDRGIWNGLPAVAVFVLGSFLVFISIRNLRRLDGSDPGLQPSA